MSQELAVIRENRNALAVHHGLPSIGATMTNQYGIHWRVDGHFFAPTIASVARGPVMAENPHDLFPVLCPQNFSPKLLDFIAETDRCTSKQFLFLDTMPHLRPGEAHPDGHWVDAWSHPSFIPVFLDAARVQESIIAHEIGHVWIDLVEDCEDYRTLRDLSDSAKVHQWTSLQSFVLDRKVNEVLLQKGFDLTLLEAQLEEMLASLACAVVAGYQPPSKAEAAFLAIPLAARMLDAEAAQNDTQHNLNSEIRAIESYLPEVYALASRVAASVQEYGYGNRASILRSIDACAGLSFSFTGEAFDSDTDLIEEPPEECFVDKYPQAFAGLPVSTKLEIGRIMAKQGIPAGTECRVSFSQDEMQIAFCDVAEVWQSPIMLHYAHRLPHEINEISARVRLTPETQNMTKPTLTKPHILAPTQPLLSPGVSLFPSPPSFAPDMPASGICSSTIHTPRRHYNTGTGLFLSRVRLWEQVGGEHPYSYAMNNPIRYIDPDGNAPIALTGGIAPKSSTNPKNPPSCNPPCKAVWLTCYSDPGGPWQLATYCPANSQPPKEGHCGRCSTTMAEFCHCQGEELGSPVFPRHSVLCVEGRTLRINDCGCGQKRKNKPVPDNWLDVWMSEKSCDNWDNHWACVCPGRCK